jgi:hypothetical protein
MELGPDDGVTEGVSEGTYSSNNDWQNASRNAPVVRIVKFA